jgi:hypothetical protein
MQYLDELASRRWQPAHLVVPMLLLRAMASLS